MTKKQNEVVQMYRLIKEEYRYDDDVFCEDGAKMRRLKYIINHRLSLVDKTIILLYADLASYRKVAEVMKLSHATIRTQVKRIQRQIMEEYGKDDN